MVLIQSVVQYAPAPFLHPSFPSYLLSRSSIDGLINSAMQRLFVKYCKNSIHRFIRCIDRVPWMCRGIESDEEVIKCVELQIEKCVRIHKILIN